MPMVPNAAILTACALRAGGFFTPRVARLADPANPEGCTSRLGRAGRASSGAVRAGPLCGKRVQRRLLFSLAKSEAVFCRAHAAPGRMVGFRRRIEERSLRRG